MERASDTRTIRIRGASPAGLGQARSAVIDHGKHVVGCAAHALIGGRDTFGAIGLFKKAAAGLVQSGQADQPGAGAEVVDIDARFRNVARTVIRIQKFGCQAVAKLVQPVSCGSGSHQVDKLLKGFRVKYPGGLIRRGLESRVRLPRDIRFTVGHLSSRHSGRQVAAHLQPEAQSPCGQVRPAKPLGRNLA